MTPSDPVEEDEREGLCFAPFRQPLIPRRAFERSGKK